MAELRLGERRFGHVRVLPVRRVRERYTRNRPRPFAFGPAVAYDARGRRVVAWIEDSYPDPGWEAEVAVGRVIGWTGGRRVSLDSRAGEVQLTGLADGVLSLSDVGSWRSSLVGAVRLAGPAGSTYRGRSIAVSPARTVFTWRGRPDGGIRAAFLG